MILQPKLSFLLKWQTRLPATELANKEKITIGPRYASERCANPSFDGQCNTKTGRYAPLALHSFDASLT